MVSGLGRKSVSERLYRTVAENWRHPDRSRHEATEIVELFLDSLEITAMEVVRIGWIEAILIGIVRSRAAFVVAWIAVIESVRHEEINDVAFVS